MTVHFKIMTLLILLFLIGVIIEIKIKPRLEYIEKSSIFVFYFFVASRNCVLNTRKHIIFKI